MNGRPLAIPATLSRRWATQARRLVEERLRDDRAPITDAARLLAPHRLHEVRGLASRAEPHHRPRGDA